MARFDSSDPAPARGDGCPCASAREDLRALCTRLFLDVTELVARVDGLAYGPADGAETLPPTRRPPTADEQLASAWQWWIDQERRR